MPSFQNPAGVTLSDERRRRLVELAREHEVLIVEDNPYGLLRYDGDPQPTLYSLDGGDYVLYLGTLSKILSPGIRIGWVAAPPPVLEKIGLGKQAADLCTSTLTQYFVREYFAEGRWREYIDDLIEIYRDRGATRCSTPSSATSREQAEWTRPEGGLFLWATLPDYIDTTDLLAKALRENVAFVPGRAAYVDGRGGLLDAAQLLRLRARTSCARGSAASAASSPSRSRSTRRSPASTAPRRRRRTDEPGGEVVPLPRAMKVAVLKGGSSLERGVSLRSAARVEDAVGALGHEAIGIDVGAGPRRAGCARSARTSSSSPCTGRAARTAPSRSCSRSSTCPTPGPGVAACALCMDKVAAKHEMRAADLPTPDWAAFNATAFRELGAADTLEEIEERLGFPLVVKPASQGSSLGVEFASSRDEVPQALVAAFSYDDRVLLERYVKGRELAVSVLDGEALPVVEAIPREEDFFNFEARYEIGRTDYVCPAELGDEETRRVQELATRTYETLGCSGFARVDLMLGDDGPAGPRGERDPRPHRHQPLPDGRRGGGDRLHPAGRADPRQLAQSRPRAATLPA